jgi:hypothetical protein
VVVVGPRRSAAREPEQPAIDQHSAAVAATARTRRAIDDEADSACDGVYERAERRRPRTETASAAPATTSTPPTQTIDDELPPVRGKPAGATATAGAPLLWLADAAATVTAEVVVGG